MTLPVILLLLTTLLLGGYTIFLLSRELSLRRRITFHTTQDRLHSYELAIAKEIGDRMAYTQDSTAIIEVITGSLRSLIPYSTVSTLLLQHDHLILRTYVEETVSHHFLSAIKTSSLESFSLLTNLPLPSQITEFLSGTIIDDATVSLVGSHFHIPLVCNDHVVGLITIASTTAQQFTKPDIEVLYRVTNHAMQTFGRFESMLRTEKEKLLSLIASLGDGVFMVDMNSKLLVVNDAARKFLTLTAAEPTIIDVLTQMPSSFNFGTKLQQVLMENKTIIEKDVQIGNSRFEISLTPVVNPHHEKAHDIHHRLVIGAAILLHDVTKERSLAKMKEDFTNVMVHELRSPLTAIKASSQLMVLQDGKLKPEERTKLLQLVSTQAQKLLDEVGLILDAAKLDAGMFTVTKVPTDLGKLIDEKIQFFKPEADNKHISLTAEGQTGLPQVMLDPLHIGQVINNLVSNSLKFTPVGGSITIKTARSGDNIVITVIDTGMGIPKEKQSSLFEKFSQIQTPNAHVGTGLGLYIVKGIVKAHGGQISLESDGRSGTSISFSLPVSTNATTTSSDAPTPTAFPPSVHSAVN